MGEGVVVAVVEREKLMRSLKTRRTRRSRAATRRLSDAVGFVYLPRGF